MTLVNLWVLQVECKFEETCFEKNYLNHCLRHNKEVYHQKQEHNTMKVIDTCY